MQPLVKPAEVCPLHYKMPQQQEPPLQQPHQQHCWLTLTQQTAAYFRWRQQQHHQQRPQPEQPHEAVGIFYFKNSGKKIISPRTRSMHARMTDCLPLEHGFDSVHTATPLACIVSDASSTILTSARVTEAMASNVVAHPAAKSSAFATSCGFRSRVRHDVARTAISDAPPLHIDQNAAGAHAATAAEAASVAAACIPDTAATASSPPSGGTAAASSQLPTAASSSFPAVLPVQTPAARPPGKGPTVDCCLPAKGAPETATSPTAVASGDSVFAAAAHDVAAGVTGIIQLHCWKATGITARLLLRSIFWQFALLLLLCLCISTSCVLTPAVAAVDAAAPVDDASAVDVAGVTTAGVELMQEVDTAVTVTTDPAAGTSVSSPETAAGLGEKSHQEEFNPSQHTPEVIHFPTERPLRFVFGSCNLQPLDDEWQVREENKLMWDFIHSRRPQLFAWLGDNIYVDTMKHFKLANTIRWRWKHLSWRALYRAYREVFTSIRRGCTERDIREALHRQYHNPPYQRLLKSGVRVVGMYDDHDLGADNPFKWHALKFEAREALLDFIGVSKTSPRRSLKWPGVFFSYQIQLSSSFSSSPGSSRPLTVRLILVDVRFNRDSWRLLPHGDLLGEQQWSWFEGELRRAKRAQDALVFIASSIEVLPPSAVTTEAWSLFPATRQRLFDRILNAGLQMPVLLSGDVHFAEYTSVWCRPVLLPEDMHRQQGSRQQQLHHHRLYRTPFPLFGARATAEWPAPHVHRSAAAADVATSAAAAAAAAAGVQYSKTQRPQPQCSAPGLSLWQVLGGSLQQQQREQQSEQQTEEAAKSEELAKSRSSSSSRMEGRCEENNMRGSLWCSSASDSSFPKHACGEQQQETLQTQQQQQQGQQQEETPLEEKQEGQQQQGKQVQQREYTTQLRMKEEGHTKEWSVSSETWTPWEEPGLLGRLFPTASFLVSYVYVHLIAPAFFSLLAPQSYLFSSLNQQQQQAAAAERQEDLAVQDAGGFAAADFDAQGGHNADPNTGGAAPPLGIVELSEFTSSGMTHGIEETMLTLKLPTLWSNYMLKKGLQRHSIRRDQYYGERLVYIHRNVQEVEFIINPVAELVQQESEQQQKGSEQQQVWPTEEQHGQGTADLAGGDRHSYTLFLNALLQSKPFTCSNMDSRKRRRSSDMFRKAEAAAAVHAAAQYFAGDPERFRMLLQFFQQLVQHHEKKHRQRKNSASGKDEQEEPDAVPSRKLNITPRKHWGACCGDACKQQQPQQQQQQPQQQQQAHQEQHQAQQAQGEQTGEQQKGVLRQTADEAEEERWLRETIWCWETSFSEPGGGAPHFSNVQTPQESPPDSQQQEEAEDIVEYNNRPGPPYPLLDASFFSLLFLVEDVVQHAIARAALAAGRAAATVEDAAARTSSRTRSPQLQHQEEQASKRQLQQQEKQQLQQQGEWQNGKQQQDKGVEQPYQKQGEQQRQHNQRRRLQTRVWLNEVEMYCSTATSPLRQAVTPLLQHIQKQQWALAGISEQQQQPVQREEGQQSFLLEEQQQQNIFVEEDNCGRSRRSREDVQRCRMLQQQRRRNAQLLQVSRRLCSAAAAAASSPKVADNKFFQLVLPQLHEAFRVMSPATVAAHAATREAVGGSRFAAASRGANNRSSSKGAATEAPPRAGETPAAAEGDNGASAELTDPAEGASRREEAAGLMKSEEREFVELLLGADVQGIACEEVQDLFHGRLWASIRLYALPFGELVIEELLSPAAYQRQQRQALSVLMEQQHGEVQQQQQDYLQQQQLIHWVCEPAAGRDLTEVYVAMILLVVLTLGLLLVVLLLVRLPLTCCRVMRATAAAIRSRSLLYLGPTWFSLLKRRRTESKAVHQQQQNEKEEQQTHLHSKNSQQEGHSNERQQHSQ